MSVMENSKISLESTHVLSLEPKNDGGACESTGFSTFCAIPRMRVTRSEGEAQGFGLLRGPRGAWMGGVELTMPLEVLAACCTLGAYH